MAGPKENNTVLYAALGGAALLLVGAIVGMKFLTSAPPPPRPPAQPVVAQALPSSTPILYRGILETDAERWGVPKMTPEQIGQPLVRTSELAAPRTIKPGETIETERLRITASIIKEWAKNQGGSGFRYDHIALAITSKAKAPIAYRVETQVPRPEKCRSQAAIAHNGIALMPGEKAERSECLWQAGTTLTVMAVETIELPPLAYYYVSRLPPDQIGLDGRTGIGHAPPKDVPLCRYVPFREIEVDGASWADVIDFYARHNCDEFRFTRGYRFRTAPGPLPAVEAPR